MFGEEIQAKIRKISISEFQRSREACGLIKSNQCIHIENTSQIPSENFQIDGKYLIDEGIQAIWHSHINGNNTLSPQDILTCTKHQIPFYLYDIKSNTFKYYDPRANSTYLDRQPAPGINDCWSLIDHWYRFEMQIILPEFDRTELIKGGWNEIDRPGWNIFMDNVDRAGFKLLSPRSELMRGDILVFNISGANSSHVGVLLNPSDGLFIHQLSTHPSKYDYLQGGWRDHLVATGRHQNAN
jgi:proteasome lid subunit RPN8/RPN11